MPIQADFIGRQRVHGADRRKKRSSICLRGFSFVASASWGANRIELTGFTDQMRDRLRAYGLFHEIISWKLRMFVPTDATGTAILAKLLERYPLERIADRAAA